MQLGGPIENFRLDAFLTAINELIRCDETIRALWLLDNLPAYYRDNKPPEIIDLKNELLKRIATPRFYANGDFDCQIDPDDKCGMKNTLRGFLIRQDVKHLNDRGLIPHIYDLGPGPYHLPIILKNDGLKFTYKSIELNNKSLEFAMPYIGDFIKEPTDEQIKIFVATELIEHLPREEEIKTEMLTECWLADIVHVSTPRYTFDVRDIDWRTKDIGHLRCYTPDEMVSLMKKIFPEYDGLYFNSMILHAKMVLRKSKHLGDILREHELPKF